MGKTYYRDYKLLKDTPNYPKDWPLQWDGIRRKYFFKNVSKWEYELGKPDYTLDYKGQSFTLEEIENKSDWFKPVGKANQFIPKFPTPKDLEEYVHLNFENRLVDDVDECRALTDLWEDKQFQTNLYEFVKSEYNRHYNLTAPKTTKKADHDQ